MHIDLAYTKWSSVLFCVFFKWWWNDLAYKIVFEHTALLRNRDSTVFHQIENVTVTLYFFFYLAIIVVPRYIESFTYLYKFLCTSLIFFSTASTVLFLFENYFRLVICLFFVFFNKISMFSLFQKFGRMMIVWKRFFFFWHTSKIIKDFTL